MCNELFGMCNGSFGIFNFYFVNYIFLQIIYFALVNNVLGIVIIIGPRLLLVSL